MERALTSTACSEIDIGNKDNDVDPNRWDVRKGTIEGSRPGQITYAKKLECWNVMANCSFVRLFINVG
jgi:hypothetical protein